MASVVTFSLLIVLALAASIVDVVLTKIGQASAKEEIEENKCFWRFIEVWEKILVTFFLYTNFPETVSTKKIIKNIQCFHGIRVISFRWVALFNCVLSIFRIYPIKVLLLNRLHHAQQK